MGLGLLLMLAAAAIAGFIITGRDVGPRGSLTADTQPIDVIIDGQPLSIPANMIRFRSARHDGAADRIDLLLSWPGLGGFTEARAADFEDDSPTAPLIFVSITPRSGLLDSDDRLDEVYDRFFTGQPVAGPAGLVGRTLSEESGYQGETVFFTPNGTARFAARCLTANSTELPATCLRDIRIGRTLSLLYRFNRAYLRDWQAMDQATRALGKRLVIDNQ